MEKTYKKIEVDGKTFIEITFIYKKLYPIEKYENQKTKAQEMLDLKPN